MNIEHVRYILVFFYRRMGKDKKHKHEKHKHHRYFLFIYIEYYLFSTLVVKILNI